jgi:hypothetical protein
MYRMLSEINIYESERILIPKKFASCGIDLDGVTSRVKREHKEHIKNSRSLIKPP